MSTTAKDIKAAFVNAGFRAEPAPTCQEPQSDWLRCGRPLPCPRHDPTCAVCREAIGDRPSTQGYADGLWRHDTCASRGSTHRIERR